MNPVSTIQGQMAPLPRANVDTDQIIPKQFLKRVERSGFGPFLFYDWAVDPEGELIEDFVINRPEYRDAVVLVSGPNFGSGSSREHAPWSLEDWGFRAIIAPSFADIFLNNCYKIGLLPVALDPDVVDRLTEIAQDPENSVVVDLETQTVTARDVSIRFEIDPFVKHCLLNGLDTIALTMHHENDIASYENARLAHRPTVQ
ncbi:3-isopropylmalate dehydratase small subunit [hydrothermal vent metagenome]|uniref:3-isopropylmalate dehydratase n=1 Tax=hydrothermal vent metagenome TaxID=652676 RepID=A0A3B0RX42_9ZZZZ